MTLAGRCLVVTRPANQAGLLIERLTALGAEVLALPLLDIGEPADPAALEQALTRLPQYQLAIFVSPSALDAVAARLPGAWPETVAIAVIGPGSARRAAELGLPAPIQPASQFDSEGLLAHPALADVNGQRIVLFRGNGGRNTLPETLLARGASVDIVEAYRRSPPALSPEQVAVVWQRNPDGVIVTSSEAFGHLPALAGVHWPDWQQQPLWFASHPNIAATLAAAGCRQVISTGSGDDAIVAALQRQFAAPTASRTPPPSSLSTIAAAPVAPAAPPASTARERPAAPRLPLSWLLFGLSLLLVAGLFIDQGHRLGRLADRFDFGHSELRSSEQSTQQKLEQHAQQLAQLERRLVLGEARLDENRQRELALTELYRDLGLREEDRLLADTELTLRLASEQLQLAASPAAGIRLLQQLQNRLAGHDLPRLTLLRKALAADLEELQHLPAFEPVLLSAKIDRLEQRIARLNTLPDETQPPAPEPADHWQQSLQHTLQQLIAVRRLDDGPRQLLTPRENELLKLQVRQHLLAAQLAIASRDATGYRQQLQRTEQLLRQLLPHEQNQALLQALSELQQQSFPPADLLPQRSLASLAALTGSRRGAR